MKTKRTFTVATLVILSFLCLSCERVENGNAVSSHEGIMRFSFKSDDLMTKSYANADLSYITLFNEEGEVKDFVLECISVPSYESMACFDTKAALYGSGVQNGPSGMEESSYYHYYDYKGSIVLTGNCFDNKAKKTTNVYYQNHFAYNEDLDLWIPGDGRIWRDNEMYEFRAHLPETLNGVDNLNSFDSYLSFDYTIPESSSDQQDIMFGYFPFGDKTRQEKGYKIADIPFRHALGSVRFMAYLSEGGNSGSTPTLAVKKVSLVNVYKKGRCTQEGGEDFQWKALTDDGYYADNYGEDAAMTTIYGESDSAFDLTSGRYTALGYDEEDGNDYVFTVIPQNLKDHHVELVLDCVSNGEPLKFRAVIAGGEWKAGYTTIYRMTPNITCGTVDLGLSVIWGDKNLGAFKSLEKGFNFLWGEASLYDAEKMYKYIDYYGNITKYNESDGLKILQPEDDPATHFSGEPWRTPTIEECMELDNTEWIDKYGSSIDLNNMFVSKFLEYDGNKIIWPASNSNSRDIMSSSLASPEKYFLYLEGWITGNNPSGYITESWDGHSIIYNYLGTISRSTFERGQYAMPVRPVIPVLIFDDYKTVRPNNIITESAGTSVSFTIAEDYRAQSWTAEAEGTDYTDSGSGSGSITIPSGATKVVIKRDTGVVIGTINVQ